MWNLFMQWQEKIDCKFLLRKLSHSLKLTKNSKKATRNFIKISFTCKNSCLTTFIPELIVGLRHLLLFFLITVIKVNFQTNEFQHVSRTQALKIAIIGARRLSLIKEIQPDCFVSQGFVHFNFYPPRHWNHMHNPQRHPCYRSRDCCTEAFPLQDMFPSKSENTRFQKTASSHPYIKHLQSKVL